MVWINRCIFSHYEFTKSDFDLLTGDYSKLIKYENYFGSNCIPKPAQ